MRSNLKKFLSLSLTLALVLALILSACSSGQSDPTPSAEPSPSQEPSPSLDPVERTKINLAVLSGPTGVGAAKLMADNENGLTANDYTVTVCTDNQQVMAGLTNGDFDVAAIATNVASNLYHKSQGGIQIAAINTLGVLYILGPADKPLTSLADLAGKTLYATGQGANPEYVLRYLLAKNGVDPDGDVEVVWQAAEEVTATMLQGQGEYCMLPVPAATALEAKSEGKIVSQISLSDVWEQLRNGSQLTMGCMVVRTEFAQENHGAVDLFLEEYKASVEYMADPVNMAVSSDLNPAELVAKYEIAPSSAIAGKAIPQCNLIYLDGADLRAAIQGYYEVLYAADPASIGGSIPDDGFYFEPRLIAQWS